MGSREGCSHRRIPPPPGEPGFAELMVGLEAVFQEHAIQGQVVLEYETQLHLGRLGDGVQSAAGDAG